MFDEDHPLRELVARINSSCFLADVTERPRRHPTLADRFAKLTKAEQAQILEDLS